MSQLRSRFSWLVLVLKLALINFRVSRGWGRSFLHDSNVRLFNRGYINEFWLPVALRRTAATKRYRGLAVGFVDIDDLKGINDSFSHHVGDEAIEHDAAILQEIVYHSCPANHQGDRYHCCHLNDTCPEEARYNGCASDHQTVIPYPCHVVARVGGDELMIAYYADDLDEARQVANRIAAKVSSFMHRVRSGYNDTGEAKAYNSHDRLLDIPLGMSVGVAWMHGSEANLGQLLNRADQAMYVVKKYRKTVDPGHAQAEVYNAAEDMDDGEQARTALWHAAVRDPRRREFLLQPVMDSNDNLAGALLRVLPKEEYDPVCQASPDDDLGFYGRVVVDTAGTALQLLEARSDLPVVYIFLPAWLVRSPYYADLKAVIARHPVAATRLHLCIRGLRLRDHVLIRHRLDELVGVIGGWVMADFGGAKDSPEIAVLSAFPALQIGQVMLDPSLVEQATASVRGLTLLEGIVGDCEHQAKTTIMMGVDTPEHRKVFTKVSQALMPGALRGDPSDSFITAQHWTDRRLMAGCAAGPLWPLSRFLEQPSQTLDRSY